MKYHTASIMLPGFICPAVWLRLTGESGGLLTCRDSDLLFDGYRDSLLFQRRISSSEIEFVFIRRALGRNVACEIFTTHSKSYFFSMNESHLTDLFTYLTNSVKIATSEPPKLDIFHLLRTACRSICQIMPTIELLAKIKLTELWQNYFLTNYEYLYWLNLLAGRSFNVLSQYPIFPWLIRETSATRFGLEDPAIYRDLAVSVTALSPVRTSAGDAFLKACSTS
jgi:hypothetical protein